VTKGGAVLQLRDTLSGATRPFVPLNPDQIGIYSCGPTIYGPAHIGNFRSFLFADLLVRWLRAMSHQRIPMSGSLSATTTNST